MRSKLCSPKSKNAKKPSYICNPESGIWVKKTGLTGKKVLATMKKKPSPKKPSPKKKSPKKKSPKKKSPKKKSPKKISPKVAKTIAIGQPRGMPIVISRYDAPPSFKVGSKKRPYGGTLEPSLKRIGKLPLSKRGKITRKLGLNPELIRPFIVHK